MGTKSTDASNKQDTAKMDRTSAGLRNALFDEIDSLRAGSSNPARARSLAMLANTALKSVEVEIEFHKYVSDVSKHDGGAKIGILELGTPAIVMN
jgi:hypothetical protein